MANTSKNNKLLLGASRKSSLAKNSSNQKENRPTKAKIKPDPKESIEMSKQLMMKKSAPKSLSKRKATSATMHANLMAKPTFADLEKMYADADNELQDIPLAGSIYQKASNSNHDNTAPTLQLPSNTAEVTKGIDTELLLSPTTCISKGAVKEIPIKPSLNLHDDMQLLSPPKKRLKFDTEYNEFDDLPPVIISPHKNCTTNSNSILKNNEQIEPLQNNLISHPTIPIDAKSSVKKLMHDDGNVSDNSSDSNKTIEYNLGTSAFHGRLLSRAFSPLPSTSKDDKIFTKNDELFLESLKLSKGSDQTYENHNESSIQTVDCPTPVLIIDDEVKEEPPMDGVIKIDDSIITVESQTNQINPTNTLVTGDKKHDNNEDDDCVFVEYYSTPTRRVPKETEIIDLEYDFIDAGNEFNSNNTENTNDEIIDVDAIIALNQSVLNKYKKPDSEKLNTTNLVVDVEMSTTANRASNHNAANAAINSKNVQIQNGNNSDLRSKTSQVIEVPSDIQVIPSTSSQIPTNINYPRQRPTPNDQNRHLFTQSTVNNLITEFAQACNSMLPPTYPVPFSLMDPIMLSLGFNPDKNQTSTSFPIPQAASSAQGTQHATTKPKKKISQPQINKELQLSPPPKKGNLGDCPICMERLTDVPQLASTICGHLFCMSCLQQAIKTNKRCPTCRKLLKNNGYHKIFL